MLITACLIVRDEEEFLQACVESLWPITHDIVIVDSGSADGTVSLAKSLGCRVYSAKWQDDFSAARNVALKYAQGDWIMMIDADERVRLNVSPDILRKLFEQTDNHAWTSVVRSFTGSSMEEREVFYDERIVAFRRDPAVHFSRRVHEDVSESLHARYGSSLRVGKLPIVVDHLGYLDEVMIRRNKPSRNIHLLTLERRDHGENPLTDYCLATEWAQSGNWLSAATLFESVLDQAPDAAFWLQACYSLCLCHLELKRWTECEKWCERGLARTDETDQTMQRGFAELKLRSHLKDQESIAALLLELSELDTPFMYEGWMREYAMCLSHISSLTGRRGHGIEAG